MPNQVMKRVVCGVQRVGTGGEAYCGRKVSWSWDVKLARGLPRKERTTLGSIVDPPIAKLYIRRPVSSLLWPFWVDSGEEGSSWVLELSFSPRKCSHTVPAARSKTQSGFPNGLSALGCVLEGSNAVSL